MSAAHQKVTANHLGRDAYLYVCQSSLRQVFEHGESTRRQYALRERAVALGWPTESIVVIDTDLGLSGADGDREGFQRLVAEVGMGRAGIVLGVEVSRLARNSTDWHRLLEICALSETLILDEDGVEETVRNAHASTLDWRSLLRRYMTDAARRDYSWSFPNRRFIDGGLYLPSIRSEGIDAIAVIIDTSGSLPAQTLADFWAEVREVATEIQPESVHVLQVDAAVQNAAQYTPDDLPDEIALKGRGGTDFRPGFAWLDERGIQPSVCVYLTDMLCSNYPDAEPSFPVVWANYAEPPSDWNREPWGERIDILSA